MKITIIPRLRDRRKRRVAAYCRVSTRLDAQEESLEAQTRYYRALIESRDDWDFAGIYFDEKSGRKTKNRPGFQRLFAAAIAGEADCILVKSISRFSRDLVDCQRYAAALVGAGVDVWFERERIRASDPSCSMALSFLSAIAQEESRAISENVKWSYRRRYRRGEYNLGSNRVLGYDWLEGRLVPNADAKFVRMIFRLYAEGKTVEEIRRAVKVEGKVSRNGKPIAWSDVLYILQNETYRGDRLLQKAPPKDWRGRPSGKRDNYESRYLTNDHEALVDDALWNAAQSRIVAEKEATALVGRRGGRPHFLYGKVFCDACGAPMTRRTLTGRDGVKYKAWTCRERHKGRRGNGCKMRTVREPELLRAICQALGYGETAEFPKEDILRDVKTISVGWEAIETRLNDRRLR